MTRTPSKIMDDAFSQLDAARAMLAALVIIERHLPFLEESGCLGDGDVIATRAAIAAAKAAGIK